MENSSRSSAVSKCILVLTHTTKRNSERKRDRQIEENRRAPGAGRPKFSAAAYLGGGDRRGRGGGYPSLKQGKIAFSDVFICNLLAASFSWCSTSLPHYKHWKSTCWLGQQSHHTPCKTMATASSGSLRPHAYLQLILTVSQILMHRDQLLPGTEWLWTSLSVSCCTFRSSTSLITSHSQLALAKRT